MDISEMVIKIIIIFKLLFADITIDSCLFTINYKKWLDYVQVNRIL